ncbi:MAG: arylesterase [Gemmatimonadota bacterium]
MSRTGFVALRAIVAIAALILCSIGAAAPRPVVLVLGDSLSAEYGLPRDSGWVKLLADRLASAAGGGGKYSVVNASISGETTSGGRTRLPALLKEHAPSVVVIELGGNDGLRGLPLAVLRDNLQAMIAGCRAAGARVLLIGMDIPPNYGAEYADRFARTFNEVARAQKVALVPFLLEGFADQLEYFQADRIHPNENAQRRMLDNVWPVLRPLLALPAGRH